MLAGAKIHETKGGMGEVRQRIVHFQAGSASAALAIIGTGLALALPDQKWIGWVLVAIGVLVFLFDLRVEGHRLKIGRGRKMLQWIPWVLIIGGPVIGAVWLYLQNPQIFIRSSRPALALTEDSLPKKFYSQKDKANLNDLCRTLMGFLRRNGGNGGGDGVWKQIATLGNDWVRLRSERSPDLSLLDRDLDSAKNSIDLYSDGLYGDGGFFKTYDMYHEELEQFFQPNYLAEIRGLRAVLDEFRNSIDVVKAENDLTRRQQLLVALNPGYEKYEQTITQFQKHLFDITQRVESFRKQL